MVVGDGLEMVVVVVEGWLAARQTAWLAAAWLAARRGDARAWLAAMRQAAVGLPAATVRTGAGACSSPPASAAGQRPRAAPRGTVAHAGRLGGW